MSKPSNSPGLAFAESVAEIQSQGVPVKQFWEGYVQSRREAALAIHAVRLAALLDRDDARDD